MPLYSCSFVYHRPASMLHVYLVRYDAYLYISACIHMHTDVYLFIPAPTLSLCSFICMDRCITISVCCLHLPICTCSQCVCTSICTHISIYIRVSVYIYAHAFSSCSLCCFSPFIGPTSLFPSGCRQKSLSDLTASGLDLHPRRLCTSKSLLSLAIH